MHKPFQVQDVTCPGRRSELRIRVGRQISDLVWSSCDCGTTLLLGPLKTQQLRQALIAAIAHTGYRRPYPTSVHMPLHSTICSLPAELKIQILLLLDTRSILVCRRVRDPVASSRRPLNVRVEQLTYPWMGTLLVHVLSTREKLSTLLVAAVSRFRARNDCLIVVRAAIASEDADTSSCCFATLESLTAN